MDEPSVVIVDPYEPPPWHVVRITDEWMLAAELYTAWGDRIELELTEVYEDGTCELVLRTVDAGNILGIAAERLAAEPNPFPRYSIFERRGFERARKAARRVIDARLQAWGKE